MTNKFRAQLVYPPPSIRKLRFVKNQIFNEAKRATKGGQRALHPAQQSRSLPQSCCLNDRRSIVEQSTIAGFATIPTWCRYTYPFLVGLCWPRYACLPPVIRRPPLLSSLPPFLPSFPPIANLPPLRIDNNWFRITKSGNASNRCLIEREQMHVPSISFSLFFQCDPRRILFASFLRSKIDRSSNSFCTSNR